MPATQTRNKLLDLLGDGQFHSGTELAQTLQLSRSAIWKQLHKLEELGLKIKAINGKGYRLETAIELFDEARIMAGLSDNTLQYLSTLEVHQHIDSTNRYLVELGRQQRANGWVCLAEQQTAGKGRRGRQWVSPFGRNIYLSFLWQFQQGFASISGLSLAAGVAVIRALKRFDIDGVGLKWPNDIYWQQQKLGGILVEVAGEAGGACEVVLGLGLNLSLDEQQADSIDQAWTDLQRISAGRLFSRNALASALIDELLSMMANFDQQGLAYYLEEWRSYDVMLNQSVYLYQGHQQITGIVQGVDDNGLLLLKTDSGQVQVFASGEVSFHEN